MTVIDSAPVSSESPSDTRILLDTYVVKRDNQTRQPFERLKIARAVSGAFRDIHGDAVDAEAVESLTEFCVGQCARRAAESTTSKDTAEVGVEEIQDLVQGALMQWGYLKEAEAYVLYRDRRRQERERAKDPDPNLVSDYVTVSKYSRYLEDKQRRETWSEAVERVKDMHKRRFPELIEEIDWAYSPVHDRKLGPSMRSMQFGGIAMERTHDRGYNCRATLIDRVEAFREVFFSLLAGCGTGYSVQWQHVEQLPTLGRIDDASKVKHHVVKDSIEGWADALHDLIRSYVNSGPYVEFAYHKIRDRGEPLKTSGGTAPGHRPLKKALDVIRGVLEAAQGRQLRPIECHHILCHVADAVLSGGIRRSAMIAVFSPDDGEMMQAKVGDWYLRNPHFARANNSVALIRSEVKKDQIRRMVKYAREFGEPGFILLEDPDCIFNPCVEALMCPRLTITASNKRKIEKWAHEEGRKIPKLKIGQTYTGWSNCNLCSIALTYVEGEEEFYDLCERAAFIGTLQASYTDFEYLGWVSWAIARLEAQLGVSLSGIMDNPEIGLNPEVLQRGAEVVNDTNARWAEAIGIEPAARTTLVKPEGTFSKAAGNIASGVHPHHAEEYFSRLEANPLEPAYAHFKSINPHMCYESGGKAWVIIPVKAPENAKLRTNMTFEEMFESVLTVQQNWVLPGTARPEMAPGHNHNVSVTMTVREDEWDQAVDLIWKHRKARPGMPAVTAMTLLGDFGDKVFKDANGVSIAPREAVVDEKDRQLWNHLIENYTPVDFTQMREEQDNTSHSGESACAGGTCENIL